jgi:F0F1-type ATP synthase assembly protein I
MPDDDRSSKQKSESTAVTWARYSEIAFIIPAGVVAGLLMGKLADYLLHTHWLTVVGIVIGAVAGFTQMIRMVTRDKNQE